MKRFILLSLFFLVSCTPAIRSAEAQSLPDVTATPVVVTKPATIPTLIPTAFPKPTATQIPCDPFVVDFCITDGHFLFQHPIELPGNNSIDVSYRYGSTENWTREPHHGVEFPNMSGTPVHAAMDGMVQFAGPDKEAVYSPWKDFYGNVVVIRHANGLYTLYAHLSAINVQAGEEVHAGDKIGEVGKSGAAIGSHLHFEVRRGGDGMNYFSTQNPELWLTPHVDASGNPFGAISFSIVDAKSNLQFVEFTVGYYPNRNEAAAQSFYVVTYTRDMSTGEENAALGDLLPGEYRIALNYGGQLYERWVEVQSGRLTQVVIVVK